MSADITLKRGDTWPPIHTVLEQENPETKAYEPIPNLAEATSVKINMRSTDGKVLVEGLCKVEAATRLKREGEVEYEWGEDDTAYAATYKVEFEIHWTATHIQTVPNQGVREILIEAEQGVT